MTRRCKGIAGCRQGWNFQARQDERAGIQDDGQGLHPGLLLVLRAVVGQDRVGEMALQNVGAPHFPLVQKRAQFFRVRDGAIATQQFHGRRWGTGLCSAWIS